MMIGVPCTEPWWTCQTDKPGSLEIRAGQIYESRVEDDEGDLTTKIVFRVDEVMLISDQGISVEGTFIEHEEDDEYINRQASIHICTQPICNAVDSVGVDGHDQLHLKMVRLIEEFPREAEEQLLLPSKSQTHADLVNEYRGLCKQLYTAEVSLHQQERLYIEEASTNSMIKGLEAYTVTGRFATTPRGRNTRIKDKDRIFSNSSITGSFAEERMPSPAVSPTAKKPKTTGKQKY